jgi:hypothetical protein
MAGQQGIYCAPDNIIPDRDRIDAGCAPNGVMQLWVMEYEVTGVGKGCAMCKATSPSEAIILLKSNGIYNGNPFSYKVTRIEQIIVPPCNGLMAEQVVTFKDITD